MNRGPAALARILTFLLGILLLAGAAWVIALYLDIDPVETWASRIDRQAIADSPHQGWWLTAVIITAVVTILLGLLLLTSIYKRRPTSDLIYGTEDNRGTVQLGLPSLASAAAQDIASLEDVRTASSKAIKDRGIPTAALKVTAAPSGDLARIIQRIDTNARDLADAVPGVNAALRTELRFDRAQVNGR